MAECSGTLDSSCNQSMKKLNLSASLKEALDTIIKKVLREMKFSMLHHGYMDMFKDDITTLKKLNHKLLSQLKDHLRSELYKICKEENMDMLLDSLDEIIAQNTDGVGQITWRPSGNPRHDIEDHVYNLKLKHKEDLDSILTELDTENERLSNIFEENHKEILERNLTLKTKMQDYTKMVDAINNSSLETEESNLFPSIPNDNENCECLL